MPANEQRFPEPEFTRSGCWQVIGTGDFNGDSKSDILWQNTDGQASIWLMNGITPTTEALVGANPGPSWHIIPYPPR